MSGPLEWLPVKAQTVKVGSVREALDKCGVEPCLAIAPIELVKEAAGKGCRPPGGHVYLILISEEDAKG